MPKIMESVSDPISGLTHFFGAVLSLIGTVFLIFLSSQPFKIWHIVSFSIYGVGMFLMFISSTVYHWSPLEEEDKLHLRKFDHTMIFFMIAGSYTPICLIPLRGVWGWSLFGSVWGIALIGTGISILWIHAPRWLTTLLYIVMGWLVIIGIRPLAQSLPTGAVIWLVIGGLLYTIGAVIYVLKKPDPYPDFFGFHEIWHIFVLLGAGAHFVVMSYYITPFD